MACYWCTAGTFRFAVWMDPLKPNNRHGHIVYHIASCLFGIHADVARISMCRTIYSHMEVPLG